MKINQVIKDWLESLFYTSIVLIILFFICWPFKVDGDSMMDTLHTNDRIVVSRISRYISPYTHGDIVVCRITNNQEKEVIVKRIVGVPGDHIQIKDGKVFLNEDVCYEPYQGNTTTIGNIDVVLEEDEYFVMGDNRSISMDSRALGPIKLTNIVGKVIAKWYPLNDFKTY